MFQIPPVFLIYKYHPLYFKIMYLLPLCFVLHKKESASKRKKWIAVLHGNRISAKKSRNIFLRMSATPTIDCISFSFLEAIFLIIKKRDNSFLFLLPLISGTLAS